MSEMQAEKRTVTGVTVTPFTALALVLLPPEFASAWSPGFDLHVRGEGDNEIEARAALVANLRDLSGTLADRALEIEEGKETPHE